jgi:hypothetical protein
VPRHRDKKSPAAQWSKFTPLQLVCPGSIQSPCAGTQRLAKEMRLTDDAGTMRSIVITIELEQVLQFALVPVLAALVPNRCLWFLQPKPQTELMPAIGIIIHPLPCIPASMTCKHLWPLKVTFHDARQHTICISDARPPSEFTPLTTPTASRKLPCHFPRANQTKNKNQNMTNHKRPASAPPTSGS